MFLLSNTLFSVCRQLHNELALLSLDYHYMQRQRTVRYEPCFAGRGVCIFTMQSWKHMFVAISCRSACLTQSTILGAVMKGVQGGTVNTSCLFDPDPTRQTISLQMCGNGIVEKGEDCDPGIGSNSTCCDVATCKFKGSAQCDPDSSACCTSQCTFAPATTVCRPSRDVNCDVQEVCTGNSSSCPADVVIPNGKFTHT